jgi:hypothetical protein
MLFGGGVLYICDKEAAGYGVVNEVKQCVDKQWYILDISYNADKECIELGYMKH